MGSGNGTFDFAGLSEPFIELISNRELAFQVLDNFPVMIEIFAPDGTAIFVNRAMLETNNIPDANMIVGKYNLLKDPVCNDVLCFRDELKRVFRGESVTLHDFPTPIQDLVDRGIVTERPYEQAFMDLHLFPVWDEDRLAYVVCTFILKRMYQGRSDVVSAKEYIECNWQDDYDQHAVARSVNMSVRQLYKLFEQHVGMPPRDYYKNCKVEHIKDHLADKSLTIAEAFASCGADSRGWIAKVFKQITGLSPREYRRTLP